MIVQGIVRGTRQGFAFLAPDDGGEEYYLAEDNLLGAVHGDRVEASLFRRYAGDFRLEASVERILERPHPQHTGNVVRLARTAFVVPDSPVLPARIRLKTRDTAAPEGAKVLFTLETPRPGASPVAILDRVLGDGDDPSLDLLVLATEHHLPGRFPDEAIDEARAAAATLRMPSWNDGPDPDAPPRTDYRDRLVLTIDPETAKDFDDAVSLQEDAAGYHLQVHIADVTWFVAEGGACDREAALRGNSVYFPGGVIPMLPEALSSLAASLVPGEDRPVLTVEIDLTHQGAVRGFRLREGIIRSAARLHYRQAQGMLDGDEDGTPELRATLRAMASLARLLRRERFAQGAFDLDVPETEMTLGPDGIPTKIWRHETLETNRLIEEFMILANRMVGRWVVDQAAPLIFRVHGRPDPAALERFAEAALTLVPSASIQDVDTIPAVRRFLTSLPEGEARTRIVQSFFLRSLKQAVYSAVDIGHFGLGIDRYCHFTSPIRRYPDLFNHRVVRRLLRRTDGSGALSSQQRRSLLESAGRHALECSRTERGADRAEREFSRLKTLRWAERRLGERFAGTIVGMNAAGLYVEFDAAPVEGFLPRAGLTPGARMIEERLAFVDAGSRFELRLGDRVEVEISRVDLRNRHLDLHLVRREGGRARASKGERRGKGSRTGRRRSERKILQRRSAETPPRRGVSARGKRVKMQGGPADGRGGTSRRDSQETRKASRPRRRPGRGGRS